jgi:AraC family transcriptional regulator of adaptative response/methylated-DNA-[protein]-cysteine methyltransferase
MPTMKTQHPNAVSSERIAERMRRLCEYIAQNPERKLTLKALAARASMSPFHFQRSFKRIVGVTPKEYIEAERLRSLKTRLRGPVNVTQAIYDAGFGSASRVYERVDTRLGMTPRQYRRGGAGVEISYAGAGTALGRMLIGATDRGVCFLQFGDSEDKLRAALADEYPQAALMPMSASQRGDFDAWMRELARRIEGGAAGVELPLDVRGTAFQLKVWKALLEIPRGAVASYGEIARQVGEPRAVRAVANACASNRIAILIPCHRVIRGDGSLGGYRWGLARKRALIDRERAASAQSAAPSCLRTR